MDDDEEPTTLAQWSKAARQRSRKAILHKVRAKREAKQRFFDTEDRMERTAEEYRRTILLGAYLPSMPTVEITVETVPLRPTADQRERVEKELWHNEGDSHGGD